MADCAVPARARIARRHAYAWQRCGPSINARPRRHPGGGQADKPLPEPPELARWQRFADAYTRPFYAKHRDEDPLHASCLLDIVSEEAFDPAGDGALRPVSRTEAFRQFTDFEEPGHEAEDPAAALAFLQAEGMVEVTDDEIRIPARFWPDAANVRA